MLQPVSYNIIIKVTTEVITMRRSAMKKPKTLSATFVKQVNQPDYYGDGRGSHGLGLIVKPMSNGRMSKSWVQRLRINGKAVNIGLGPYPLVTLADARKKALENRQTVLLGKDPRGGIPTFEQAFGEVLNIHADGWKDRGKSEKQWRASIRDYAMPALRDRRIDRITTADVMAVLIPHWQDKPETMRRVRQRISAVMKWSIAKGYRDDNPAGEALTAALPKHGSVREHLKALPYAEVGAAIARIRQSGAYWATVSCFEFLTLTAVRSGEARLARWDEIDVESATWTIPGERMKTGREHRVPLSVRALEILEQARAMSDGSGYIFPSLTGRAMSNSTISKLIRENGIGCVPHGMRSSFRDWAAECTDAPREVCELALAHVNSDRVEAAYRRTDLFDRRRALMQAWADHISP